MRALKLFQRADNRPSLKDRAAALRARLASLTRRPDGADPQRRIMVAGSFAAALPLPALAAPAVLAGPHPDEALLAAGARYERAIAAESAAHSAWETAWVPMQAALDTCPAVLIVRSLDRWLILGGHRWPTLVGGYLRPLPPVDGAGYEAWTGEVLRNVIQQAVPRLGRGGQTPHHVRRWKAMLPAVDAFDARVRAVEVASDYPAKIRARDAARRDLWDALRGLDDFVATTPEGLALLIRANAVDHGRGCHISPNLLTSAANVVGFDLDTVARPRPGFFR